MRSNEKVILLTLGFVQFTHVIDFMIMMPLGPQFMRLFSIGPKEFSILVSAFTIAAGISGLLGAMFIDKFDRKTTLTFCYSGFILGTTLCGFSDSYYILMIARIVTGLFGGVMSALILSIISDIIPMERRGMAMGIVMSAFSVASVIGVPTGLYLATEYNWHIPFWSVAILSLPVLLMIRLFIPSLSSHMVDQESGINFNFFRNILKDKNQLNALMLTVTLVLGWFIVIPFISPFMVSNIGFRENQLPLIYLVGGVASIFTGPVVGKLSDKFGRFKIFRIFVFVSIIAISSLTNLPKVSMAIALLVTSLFFICSSGRMVPVQAMLSSAVHPKIRGSFMSVNSAVQQLTAGLAAFIGGVVVTKSESGALEHYALSGLIAIAFSLCALYFSSKIKVVEQS